MLQKTYSQEGVSEPHFDRLWTEVEHLYQEQTHNETLVKENKAFEIVKHKHAKQLEEMKDYIESSDQDKIKMRQRLTDEIDKAKVFAISKFSKEILEIFDNLERAMEHAKEDEKESNWYKGLEMTFHQGLSTMKRFDIQPMEDPIGNVFDPKLHEVVFEMEKPDLEVGTITVVLSKGYLINDRVLRAAKVGVSRKP